MEMQEIIRQAESNIRQAVEDYGAHTYQMDVLEDISDEFIERLARDSSYAKQGLRELFSKSPVWHPELDALIINGTRTHDPDYRRVDNLAHRILSSAKLAARDDKERMDLIMDAIAFFSEPDDEDTQEAGIEAIKKLAPKAYQPGKKRSRIFKSLCVALGVADETKGSEFQHLYAQFADELSSRKLGFKLFVSINPAHFLTMSNPKNDRRGACLTSCHSLNSTEYEYNCGCTGYARDEVSFLVFTVADPEDRETLNNRKTTRQVFAYQPGNGVLLQSRMYNTEGGVYGAAEDSGLYRDLIQREISMLEEQPNLWKVYGSVGDKGADYVYQGQGFGGYPDWIYDQFDGRVCIRFDHLEDAEPLEVGTYGLCVKCGDEISTKMYCDDCEEDDYVAYYDDCEEGVEDEDDLYEVYDSDGHRRYVCQRCLERSYTRCDHCDEYHADSVMESINGRDVCPDCLREHYSVCDDCDEYCLNDEMYRVIDQYGSEVWVCEDCRDDHYETCEDCGELVHEDLMYDAISADGKEVRICEGCKDSRYETCDHCGELVHEDLMCDAINADGEDVRVCKSCYEEYDYAQYEIADEDEVEAEMKEAEMKEAV